MKKILLSLLMIAFHCHLYSQSGMWTWMGGDSAYNASAVYGVKGVADSLNHPPGLHGAAQFQDAEGNFWLFGGGGHTGRCSDLWKFDPATDMWTWVTGPGLPNKACVYGTKGIPSPTNTPGARNDMASWVDLNGNFWLYGGYGYTTTDFSYGYLCDLWNYNLATNEWTWVCGLQQADMLGNYGTQLIPDTSNSPGSRAGTNATWVDSTGNLWLFGGRDVYGDYNTLMRYNISTREWTWMKGTGGGGGSSWYGTQGEFDASNHPAPRLAYSAWTDIEGKFWMFGGHSSANNYTYNDVWEYDPATNMWAWMAGSSDGNPLGSYVSSCEIDSQNVPGGRWENRACWYDCNGHFWNFGGISDIWNVNIKSDLWLFDQSQLQWALVNGSLTSNQPGHYGVKGVADSVNYPASRWGAISWTDANCNLWLFGGGRFSTYNLNDLWKFTPDPNCPSGSIYSMACKGPGAAIDTNKIIVCGDSCIDFNDLSVNLPTSWQWNFPGGNPSSSSDKNPTDICYSTTGTYDVSLVTSNIYGTDTLLLHHHVAVYPIPSSPSITQSGDTLTSSTAAFYQWQFNTIDIPGATNQSYTATQTGYYSVIISDSGGCSNSAIVYVVATGIHEIGKANISVYPNPSNGNFTIELLCYLNADEVSIRIVNTLGQEVFSDEEKISSMDWKKQICLSELVSGVYFIEIKTKGDFPRGRIVVE